MHLLEINRIRVAPYKDRWAVEVNRWPYLDYTWETYSKHATQEEAGEKVKEMRTEIKRLNDYNRSLETWKVK